MKNKETELAFGWPISKVEAALTANSQDDLTTFMRNRYSERYFEPLDILNSPQKGPGFAAMSLSCLLIETFQAYRTGLPSSNSGELKSLSSQIPNAPKARDPYYIDPVEFPRDNGEPFRCFFISNAFFPNVDGGCFYQNIRNGLLHQSQTKHGWRVKVGTGQLWNEKEKIVDRGLFVRHLRMYFNFYLEQLEGASSMDKIVTKAKRKIWWLCQLSK